MSFPLWELILPASGFCAASTAIVKSEKLVEPRGFLRKRPRGGPEVSVT